MKTKCHKKQSSMFTKSKSLFAVWEESKAGEEGICYEAKGILYYAKQGIGH